MRILILYALLGAILVAVASIADQKPPVDPSPPVPEALLAGTRPPNRDELAAPADRIESESAARMHEQSIQDFAMRAGFGLARMFVSMEPAKPFQLDGKDRVVTRQRPVAVSRARTPCEGESSSLRGRPGSRLTVMLARGASGSP